MRQRVLSYLLCGIAAAIFWPAQSGEISAQIRVRIPRPRSEKQVPPPAPGPTTTATPVSGNPGAPVKPSSNDAAQMAVPASVIIDDGYTFFQLRGKKDYVDGKPIDKGWSLLALSGGYPLTVFGEWDGEAFLPLGAWVEGRFVGFWSGL